MYPEKKKSQLALCLQPSLLDPEVVLRRKHGGLRGAQPMPIINNLVIAALYDITEGLTM